MSNTIRDITSEHVGAAATDHEARLTRDYLLAHGHEDSEDLDKALEDNEWFAAIEWAIRIASGYPLPDDPDPDQIAFDARNHGGQ